ncbi:MAG: penicillin-binding protein 1C [Bacteroidales bacterium]|jgi:penicillin-binding protein 1C|nr:penicillin-binding protein 1C [Bacteroidales bacterium]
MIRFPAFIYRLGNCHALQRKHLLYGMVVVFLLLVFFFWQWLPRPLFSDPTSTVLLDRNGQLLGAKISDDQQWRFPESEQIPEKFKQAILQYEDQYFRYHPGFNPVSLIRAAYLNFRHHRIVSGGSTITMQVIRLTRKNKERTYLEKIREVLLAFRLELGNSKANILRFYASHAPFGGNVVGLEAAAWRYFGVSAEQLSWAETATLAVLPNSPGLIYPGRNPNYLLAKRDRLLDLLKKNMVIDSTTCALAKSEKLPEKPFPLPQLSPHLLDRMIKEGKRGERIRTTLDLKLQERINTILDLHSDQLKANEIHNAAAMVLDVNSGNVLGYSGNLPHTNIAEHGNNVDIITSVRSTGSILKPFLYAAMLNDGLLLPNTLVPDIPMQIGGFIPENYNLAYDGAVPAKRALSRSLNIPAVKMLQTYGYAQFYALLRKIGMTTLVKPADHYGLALILGGAEATLWDLAGIYASMARTLNHFSEKITGYSKSDFHPPLLTELENAKTVHPRDRSSWFDAASIWLTFEAMVEVARPDEELQWQSYSSSHKIAWKTGTSFGNRDAWSVGITPEYVVMVWVGNASGEGRPGLTGIGVAAPILFDIFKALPPTTWFATPYQAMVQVPVCRYSGYRASSICEFTDTVWIPKSGMKTVSCPFHQMVHLDKTGRWQVHSGCEAPDNMQHVSWFVLPPVQEWYFRNKNPFYKTLPPFRFDCLATTDRKNMEIIYPKNNSKIYVPVELDGKPGSAVLKLAHRNPNAVVYWHLDDKYLGTTMLVHQMAVSPGRGIHLLTLVDQNGETLKTRFEILTKE